MASFTPLSLTLRLRSLGATSVASALGTFALKPLSTVLRATGLRQKDVPDGAITLTGLPLTLAGAFLTLGVR